MVEQQAEAAFAPLIAIALQIVAAKLVDHDDDDQLGTGVVGGTEARAGEAKAQQKSQDRGAQRGSHCGVVYSVETRQTKCGLTVWGGRPGVQSSGSTALLTG